MDISRSTLGELAGLAIERELIKHCTFSKSSVGIAIEDLNVSLSPDDARKLLQLVVAGAEAEPLASGEKVPGVPAETPESGTPSPDTRIRESVFQDVARSTAAEVQERKPHADAPEASSPDTYLKREVFRAPHVSPQEVPTPTASPREELRSGGGDGDNYGDDAVSEEYLDSVLSFALTMGIIEGYTKDRDSRTVTLRTGATTTGLSYWETLEYLTNSMLYELRPRSES